MATIKYILQSKSNNAPIYLRLSLGRGKVFKRKTSLSIKPINWSDKGYPKQTTAENKNLASQLRGLNSFVLDQVNISETNGENIDGNWLKSIINLHFNKSEIEELDYLVDYGKKFLDNLEYKSNSKTKKIGVTDATKKKYQTIVNKLIAFDNYKKQKTKITDVNLSFRIDLINYLKEVDKLSDNTIGRYLKFVKSICLDAEKNGHKVNSQLKSFLGFSIEAPKVILSLNELEQIKNTEFVNENHKIARDWLIIGCFTGQRVSDLLRMNRGFIQHIQDFDFIVLTQQKTKQLVQIPIHFEVKTILDKRDGEFPPVFTNNLESSKALFNRYLKQLCKLAKIDTIVKGNKFDEVKKRYLAGEYPKHELVSSHICRRSFASNHYATELYPTPILMNITAHKTEQMFLTYIGKEPIDYSVKLAKIWQKLGKKKKNSNQQKTDFKIIKKAN
ncbi:phage integrase SAM-like domain-containing protein [uncultured Polaribacter sp.]|uniref:phage integrase SAM-like domain-containing protein n=1 Tax=uncultured Polaribacter sp. TaxID=174711 RepID=UPI00262993D7|nr:phage integrase SAM-like domain-containing protein [uncultured Polaribacter sp.]